MAVHVAGLMNKNDNTCSSCTLWNVSVRPMTPKVEFKNCVKVKVAFLGSPSLVALTASVDVKQH